MSAQSNTFDGNDRNRQTAATRACVEDKTDPCWSMIRLRMILMATAFEGANVMVDNKVKCGAVAPFFTVAHKK